jgi:hypothetical protein
MKMMRNCEDQLRYLLKWRFQQISISARFTLSLAGRGAMAELIACRGLLMSIFICG